MWLGYDVQKKLLTFDGDRKKDHDSAAGFWIWGWLTQVCISTKRCFLIAFVITKTSLNRAIKLLT